MNKLQYILILLSIYFTTVQTSEERLFNFELSNEQNENSFKLPDEIQLHILKYVAPESFKLMHFVCKKMHNLCNDISLEWNRTHSKIMDDIEMFSIAVQEDKKHITLFFKGVYGFFSNQEYETYASQLNHFLIFYSSPFLTLWSRNSAQNITYN